MLRSSAACSAVRRSPGRRKRSPPSAKLRDRHPTGGIFMPLSNAVPRKLIHTRAIECKGYEREDGLWDIEAHLTDVKSVVHSRREGGRARQPGEPVHDMWLRVTIDLDM